MKQTGILGPEKSRLLRYWQPTMLLLLGTGSCAERPTDRAANATSQPTPVAASAWVARTEGDRPSAAPDGNQRTATQGTLAGESRSAVRRAQKAGGWYPEDRAWATAEMHRMFRVASTAPHGSKKPLALIVPHAGWKYSGVAAAAAFRNLHRGDFQRVVLLGPSHGYGFQGFSVPNYEAFETPLGRIPVCREAAELRDGELVRDVPEADRGEHSLELELPWLQETLGSFCIVPILVGSTNADSERALATRLAPLKNDATLFVVSSDFVHYGSRFDYAPFGADVSAAQPRIAELENQAIGLLSRKDAGSFRRLIAKTQATICGFRGQLVLLEVLGQAAEDAEALTFAHYSSADLAGERDESGSVGYVSLGYFGNKPGPASRPLGAPQPAAACAADAEVDQSLGQRLIDLAKATLQTKLRGSDALDRALASLPDSKRLDCRQAVFVTLKAKGDLRGCVGQVEPTYPLAEAIVRSAIDAAVNDRRFSPVSPDELDGLSFEVTVLSVPHELGSYRDIVLGKHGIILSVGNRRALFLPQVPGEQGWGLDDTLRALSRKAGLDEDAWKGADARYSVFTGKVFDEQKPAQTERQPRRNLAAHGQ
jgi:MEMO1 family protein